MRIKIAFVQLLPGIDLDENLDIGKKACVEAKEKGADIALFPEMWSDGYYLPQDEKEVNSLAISMELRKDILRDTIDKIESEKPDIQNFMAGLDRLHTTNMGVERIKRNLNLDCDDVVFWCRQKIMDKDAVISRQGKNWYIKINGCEITVNAKSYTIITAHKI